MPDPSATGHCKHGKPCRTHIVRQVRMTYLLDTTLCIYLIRRQPPSALARLAQVVEGDAVMSAITYAELRASLERLTGNARTRDEQVLERLVDRIPVLDFNDASVRHHGVLPAALQDRRRDP
jgi:tRNA(fMet)-specific endonuclease VapC